MKLRTGLLLPVMAASLLAVNLGVSAAQDAKPLSETERAELQRLRAEVHRFKQEQVSRRTSTSGAFARGKPAAVLSRAGDPYPYAIDPKALEKKYATQPFFLRKEAIDASYYLYPLASPPDTKGASITLTRDDLASTTALAVQGFASYVLWRPDLPNPPIEGDPSLPRVKSSLGLSGFAAAPFVYANGTLTEPRKASEKNALRAGIDNQFELSGGDLFPVQTLRFTPYGQTDFRGIASIGGFSGTYEPYLPQAHLGVNPNLGPQYIGWYFRTVAEANVFRVNDAGLTNFAPRTTYGLLGGTAELNATLWQNMPDAPLGLCGRVHLNAQYQYFRDVVSNADIRNFHSGVSVDLGGKPTPFCVAPGVVPTADLEKISVALTYDRGTDKSTLVDARKYQLQLTLQY